MFCGGVSDRTRATRAAQLAASLRKQEQRHKLTPLRSATAGHSIPQEEINRDKDTRPRTSSYCQSQPPLDIDNTRSTLASTGLKLQPASGEKEQRTTPLLNNRRSQAYRNCTYHL